ncbi:hypothetical protein DY000_02033030 [Brassica cretica]|uniref:DUF4283 domain-containing protein n=1 Tax=Brassica cretica TaxID=69181 RepID=A0ABQ7DFK8_BRACR|nr:hypothetical protein DY000_02033030 [Brassica cretica]
MVDCNGELACLWQDFDVEKKIWCAMIALDKVGVEIHGRVQWRADLKEALVGGIKLRFELVGGTFIEIELANILDSTPIARKSICLSVGG